MKRLIQNIRNIWKVEELRKRILLTLGLILAYRIGSFIIIPGVNYAALTTKASDQNALETLLSLFSGGGFTNASIMALGIMPYISASIIMQLLSMAVPAVQKMQNEGESGRKQINNYTRILTIIICALQAPSYLSLYVAQKGAMPVDASTFWWTQTILILVAGSMFAVWLGERITEKGIGNGISLLITVGILSRLPGAFFAEFGKSMEAGNLIKLVIEVVAFMLVVLVTILIVQGVRSISIVTRVRSNTHTIQCPLIKGGRTTVGGGGRKGYIGSSNRCKVIEVQENGIFKMWYCSGTGWNFPDGNAEPAYTVFYAESRDGVKWDPRGGPIIPYNFDGEVISAPWVVKTTDGYRMWYCFRGSA
ncbi:MAG: hypothetical protein EBU61_06425, partial [Crocinitomicaceae bacterium]|nr:hypothetical protein [Crocinitomicaceae bacterium]